MLAKLFVLLALTNVAFSVKNLRNEPAAAVVPNAPKKAVAAVSVAPKKAAPAVPATASAAVPSDTKLASVNVNNKRAAAILKSMTKKTASVQKKDAAYVRERAQALSAKGRHEIKMSTMSISGDKAVQSYACDQGWQLYEGKCYYSGVAPTDYESCNSYCASIGSTMPCVEDHAQNGYLMEWQGMSTWIGYDDRASEGNFVWPQGCPSSYTYWKPGEPNNAYAGEHCTFADFSSSGGWQDVACSDTVACVCERAPWQPEPPTEHWDVVTDGYYITRHRPNGDCSGVSTMVTAQRVDGTCHMSSNTSSYMEGCNRKNADGMVSMATGYFDNGDCEGMPYYVSHYGENHEECEFDLYNSDFRAPAEMLNVQCTDNAAGAFRKGGFAHFIYKWGDDMCQSKPQTYSLQKYGACTLQINYDNEYDIPNRNTTFSYTTIDSCTHNGMMTVSSYTDPACTRREFTGTANIADVMPDFNNCMWDSNMGAATRSVCLAPGGPPPF